MIAMRLLINLIIPIIHETQKQPSPTTKECEA